MTAVEKIVIAEEKVAELQDHLATVETVLEKAEEFAGKGQKAGGCVRRLFQLLLLVSIIAVVAVVVKKMKGGRAPEYEPVVEEAAVEEAAIEEALIEEAEIDEDTGAS
ncbi:MAG: hypothetical protein MUQ27_09675 [Acidimicrobiia bacterium]|nr:hypothetical protein [Acidimicrobiia bacterium]